MARERQNGKISVFRNCSIVLEYRTQRIEMVEM